MIKMHFDGSLEESLNEEVTNETHGNADFMTQDIASNVVNSSSVQMQNDIASNSSIF